MHLHGSVVIKPAVWLPIFHSDASAFRGRGGGGDPGDPKGHAVRDGAVTARAGQQDRVFRRYGIQVISVRHAGTIAEIILIPAAPEKPPALPRGMGSQVFEHPRKAVRMLR